MNLQQVGQAKSSNGYGRRKSEKEGTSKSDNKIPSGKSNATRLVGAGAVSKGGSYESPSHDRLVYLTTCLIGHQVEVQVKNGSVYSGIFHATNTDKDFGIILKMACLTNDGSSQGKASGVEFSSKAPSKTLIIPAEELVQVIAKDVAVSIDGLASESHYDMHQDIMVDSVISQARHVEKGRELHRWVPDEDDPQCPELENIFDGSWNNRGWDQFETNEMLFGVKSTFDEDLYTTKLEKGPQMRELENQALKLAREIEGEDTQDLHLAEERGIYPDDFDIDEETRFSSVYRGKGIDDSGYDENEDNLLDSHNSETFGDISDPFIKRPGEISSGKCNTGAQTWSNFSSADHLGLGSSQSKSGGDFRHSGSYNLAKELASELPGQSYPLSEGENRIQDNSVCGPHGANNTKEENQIEAEDVHLLKSEGLQSALNLKKDASGKGGLYPTNATSYAPSTHILSKSNDKSGSPGDLTRGSQSGKANGETKSLNLRGRLESCTSSGSDCLARVATFSGPSLSPSSSVCSLSSEKSTLNPNAKEFRLNPNAKSFVPSQTPVRPRSPVADGSFYYPANVSTVPSMPAMPMGVGAGPSFAGQQPIMYNPQMAQMPPQPYFHPNGPQYGQMLGHPRQVLYMPSYLPETPYKGRNY